MKAIRYVARQIRLRYALLRHRRQISTVRDRKRDSSRGGTYNPFPRCSAVVQFFNKHDNIDMLEAGLRAAGFEEVVVIDDGSSDGSLTEWAQRLTLPNDILIRCNDIFEVHSYELATRMSRAPVIALLQDDDWMPEGPEWVQMALSIFEDNPRMAVLGGWQGLEILEPDVSDVSEDVTSRTGLFAYRAASHNGAGFKFVMAVNRAPMFVRREALLELGGIDPSFAPFQCDDIDLCLRAWKSGWQVGLYDAGFPLRSVGEGGMRLYNGERVARQVAKNWPMIYDRHGQMIAGGLQGRVNDLNGALVGP